MPAPRDSAAVVRAARLYYEQECSQSEVARELGISRSNVSRILAQARERGIVEILIHDPEAPPVRDTELEEQLARTFGLDEAVVVSATRGTGLDVVSRAAAQAIAERAPKVRSIGVSWGQTLQRVVAELPTLSLRPRPRVLPLVGGLTALDQLASGDSVLRVLAERMGATPEPLFAPALVQSAAAQRTFRGEASIASVLGAAAQVELGLVGIGSIDLYSSPHLVQGMHLDAAELRTFETQGAVGDLCGRFVDRLGRPLGPPTSERVLAVTFEELREIPEVLGVAAGAEKAPGVLGVLRSGVLQSIVVDAQLADAVLARASAEPMPR
ncbi:MAG: sugar-binding domain-containing protein [Brachybacterium sp.]|nr:sugar-binding domain-containing protein [Brachybacterium sp.]